MGLLRAGWVPPSLLVILAASVLIVIIGTLADAASWIAHFRRGRRPGFADLFRVWPLPMWILAAALLPDLTWRIAAGAMAAEHAALLFLGSERRTGRVIAVDSK